MTTRFHLPSAIGGFMLGCTVMMLLNFMNLTRTSSRAVIQKMIPRELSSTHRNSPVAEYQDIPSIVEGIHTAVAGGAADVSSLLEAPKPFSQQHPELSLAPKTLRQMLPPNATTVPKAAPKDKPSRPPTQSVGVAAMKTAFDKSFDTVQEYCRQLKSSSMSVEVQQAYKEANCLCFFDSTWSEKDCKDLVSPVKHELASATAIHVEVDAWVRQQPPIAPTSRPVIAILVSVVLSSRVKDPWTSVKDTPVYTTLLASAAKTFERGYDYWFFIGTDAGDRLFDTEHGRAELQQLFASSVAEKAGKEGITAMLRLLTFRNPLRKPGPMFNFLSACAAAMGADFLFRINDDTALLSPFASPMIEALASLHPPFFGIAGPTCKNAVGNHILTHDFVHRTHLAVFPTHYPAVFTDWYLDDWISLVYTPANTLRVPAAHVDHKTAKTRYNVTRDNNRFLKHEYQIATTFQAAYQRLHPYPAPTGTPARTGTVVPLPLALGGEARVTLTGRKFTRFQPGPVGIRNLISGPGGGKWWEGEKGRIQRLMKERGAGGR